MTRPYPGRTLFVMMALAIFTVGATTISAETIEETVSGEIGNRLAEYLDRLEAIGYHGSVLAAKDGEILLHKAYGLANPSTGVPNRISTLFSTGSVTKQYTATAIMLLVERGEIAVTDSIGKFFEGVPPDKQGITIHHLLTHSAGLLPQVGQDEEVIARDAYVARVLASELQYPPGTKYDYSNAGFSMLAAIVEKVSGKKYEEFLRKELWQPAGMHRTGLNELHLMDSMVACSHNASVDYMSPAFYRGDYWNRTGNGGILTTPGDMWLWLQALRSGKAVSTETLKKMHTPYIREYEDGESFYGYGWVVEERAPGDTVIWHNGGSMPHGWGCAVYQYLKHGIDVIVFSNKPINGNLPVDMIAMNLAAITRGEEVGLPPEAASLTDGQLARFVGEFTLGEGRLEIVRKGDQLYARPFGQSVVEVLFPSPMARFLPRYNDLTKTLVGHLAGGQWEAATDMFDRGYDRADLTIELKSWWQQISATGQLSNITVSGTVFEGAAKTYCRLSFTTGLIDCHFGWMQGECIGMMDGSPLERELIAESAEKLVAYDLNSNRSVLLALSEDGNLILSAGDQTITATRN